MLDRFFRLKEHNTNVRTELLAGLTTFLTMAYIIFLQPAVLSGKMFGFDTGMDAGAVATATCLAAALATAIMALYARYPIAQAPGMGENFFFVFSVLPAAGALAAVQSGATEAWQVALGVVFIAGVLFLLLSLLGIRSMLLETISPSMRNAIAVGIGTFIAFIGLQNAGLVVADPATCVTMNVHFDSPDLLVFFFGLIVTAALHARGIRGSIIWGILAATLMSLALLHVMENRPEGAGPPASVDASAAADQKGAEPEPSSKLQQDFAKARAEFAQTGPVKPPPSVAPTFFKMDVLAALAWPMVPFILVFLFMDLFDTLGTLVGVSEQAELVKDNKLPRANQAMFSDAVGTVVGATLGTSTVTSFIESTAGVEQGGRTGLTSLTTAVLFLVALFFSPLIALVGSYPPITAPALVVVGSMMMSGVTKIQWKDFTEAMPAFLIIIGIPLTYSIADGLALGFISYPILKLLSGKGREVKWLMYVMAAVLVVYFVVVRVQAG